MNVGLCLLSGTNEIYNRLMKLNEEVQKYMNTHEFLETIKMKGDVQNSKYKPYWHILQTQAHWLITLNKQTPTIINILTSSTPYQP